MSLEEKLLQLDKVIWHQHEKVTQKAHKELGWNKYDLARLMQYGAVGSYLGAGIYEFLSCGISEVNAINDALFGTLFLGLSFFHGKYIIPQLKVMEEAEIYSIIKYGTSKTPQYNSYRPSGYFTSALIIGLSSMFFINGKNDYDTLSGLVCLTLGTEKLFDTSSSYFQDQILTPPTKKKSFWKTMYEKATSLLRPKQLVPSPEQTPYQTLDRIVE